MRSILLAAVASLLLAGAASAGVPPAAPSPGTPTPQPSAAFQQGQLARQAWETWFNGLTGDRRAGADYWAGQRSLRQPGSCIAVRSLNWIGGCYAAQRKLAESDVRRKTEPDYRLGWNHPPAAASAPVAADTSATPGTASPPLGAVPTSAQSTARDPLDPSTRWYTISDQTSRCTDSPGGPAKFIGDLISMHIPYRPDDIRDRNGTVIATSITLQRPGGGGQVAVRYYRGKAQCQRMRAALTIYANVRRRIEQKKIEAETNRYR